VTDEDRVALIALARQVGLDAPGLAERVETVGPDEALADALGQTTSLLPEQPGPLLDRARADLERWRTAGVRTVTVLDAGYPENLRAVHDRPVLIFVAGELADADRRAIAVVGSRAAGDAQLDAARMIAGDLVASGHTVVSGLAAGIDTAVHNAALNHHGRTLAVIGAGHEHAYPPENATLQRELVRDHGVVSPFWPDTPPSADGFRRRNGVMSGLSRGTVIVAAGPRSGTRVQARLALAHGRPVFLLPDLLAQSWAAELSARPNVHVVASAAEVIWITNRLAEPLDEPGAA
jgi:DNA processing protein